LRNFLLEEEIKEIVKEIENLMVETNYIDNFIDSIDDEEFKNGIMKIEKIMK
jgi:hypothetical protein